MEYAKPVGRDCRARDAVKAIASGDEVACQHLLLTGAPESDLGLSSS